MDNIPPLRRSARQQAAPKPVAKAVAKKQSNLKPRKPQTLTQQEKLIRILKVSAEKAAALKEARLLVVTEPGK